MLPPTVNNPDVHLPRLTLESNALIHTVILRAVTEEGVDPTWITSIKSSIADFGEYISSGNSLSGLRAFYEAQSEILARERKAARERLREEREPSAESKAGKLAKSNYNDDSKENEMKTLRPNEERKHRLLKDMHGLISAPPIEEASTPKYLVTTMSFQTPEHDNDSNFYAVSTTDQCVFIPDQFSLPFFEDEQGKHGDGGFILCGLDQWSRNEEVKPRIIGGDFAVRELTSATIVSLSTILRLTIYTYLSLILEQEVLSNSHVSLHFPPTQSSPSPVAIPLPASLAVTQQMQPLPKRKNRAMKVSSGIWSFISKRTENIFHRGNPIFGDLGQPFPRKSLDSGTPLSSPNPPRYSSDIMMPEDILKASHDSYGEDQRPGPFMSALRGIQDPQCILSTSPGVVYPLPILLSRLAAKEHSRMAGCDSSSPAPSVRTGSNSTSSTISAATAIPATTPHHSLRLTGAEKAGLGSLLGWEGREALGKGMAGVRGFVRHQGLTVLHAQRVTSNTVCGSQRLMTFRYWSRSHADDAEPDKTLGDMVESFCANAEETCELCDKPRSLHIASWSCSGMQICAAVGEDAEGAESEDIVMWESCTTCSRSTERVRMSDGTYLFSFGKFLELILWSPMLASLSLCEHTRPSSSAEGTQFCVMRHFGHGRRVVTFSLTSITEQLFEIRVPKLQISSGSVPKEEKQLEEARRKRDSEEERQLLFTEMDEWWENFMARLDRLDVFLQQEIIALTMDKNLPPLPMSDDEDLYDGSWITERTDTSSPRRFQPNQAGSSTHSDLSPAGAVPAAAPYPPGLSISIHESRQLLAQLRSSFEKSKNSVRKQAGGNTQASLNDVRRNFRSTARGAFKRLVAWQKKHAPGAPTESPNDLEPEWWQGSCHAVPGGRVIVRESELGSVIAFTLSSRDYQRELANVNSISPPQSVSSSSTADSSELLSMTSVATTKTLRTIGTTPDPDDTVDTSFWEEYEPWTAVITRREHPRELSSLLSIRDVLRNKKLLESTTVGSRFSALVSRGAAPPSAWTQPQVQINLQSAGGQVTQFPEAAEEVERMLESQHPVNHQEESTWSSDDTITPTPSSFFERNIRSGKTASILSFDTEAREQYAAMEASSSAGLPVNSTTTSMGHASESSSTSAPTSLSSALSNAMHYFLSTGSSTSSVPSSASHSSAPHHGLLAIDTAPIDDRPHIKYEWTIGRRVRFSCTVYYAKQFDVLRKRCGVDGVMLKSLERTANWTAVGGKSKANFWKSGDDRFIIKTLVNAWNVADLQVLLDLGPSYFRYMDSTTSKASALAKLMGFYTVEIKNLETGTVQTKTDLLITENLFYKQKVSQVFDLKGIQGRRTKPNGDTEHRTLFDGEWIDRQQRSTLLIQPHSRLILRDAIKSDADFLAKSNIMDYSLLIGIDEERHEIACGIVDTIGSYTFAKTLEYKAKQNLGPGKGKDVTVLPPAEYQNRFVNAVEGYFLACPDKWTKPFPYVDRTSPDDLPSVL